MFVIYLITVMFVAAYLLPFLIALIKDHTNKLPILVLNALLGWTVVGWIVALIWSLTKNVHVQVKVDQAKATC